MKRRISFILVVTMMAIALWACDIKAKKEDTKKEEQKTETVVEEQKEETVSAGEPAYAYTAVQYDNDYQYFDGKIQCVELTDDGHPELKEAVNNYFSKQIQQFNKSCESYLEDSKKANQKLSKDEEDNAGAENENVYDYTAYYSYDIYCEVTRCDNEMLSIKLDEYSFTGGAHGTTIEYGVTFDAKTGEILENSSFDGFKDIVKEEILNRIDNSTEEATSSLFEDYKDTINHHFEGGLSTLGVYFNERGIVVAFEQAEIVPYAAGIPTFNIPYSKLVGFDEKYLPEGDFYTAEIPSNGFAEMVDVNGDGEETPVYLETIPDEDLGDSYILHIGDDTIENGGDDAYYMCSPMFVHSSTGNYFILDCTGMSDWHTTYLYNADKNYTLVQSISGNITEISDGKCTIQAKVDAFGSWGAKKEYTYDGNGFVTTDKVDNLDNLPSKGDDAIGITLLKKLTYTDKDGKQQTLSKGTVIYPTVLDGDKLEFMTEDGAESGYFTFEYKDGVRYVDGVSEYDLFADMPYAG
ncbi:DUF3298 and DUF4163 domain-containing protein [Pseudobutyrivibrio ruminis]|nr:DUF3298 and DUF4163 domain-containing protein [Pseudobutyrivibrio ruminis]